MELTIKKLSVCSLLALSFASQANMNPYEAQQTIQMVKCGGGVGSKNIQGNKPRFVIANQSTVISADSVNGLAQWDKMYGWFLGENENVFVPLNTETQISLEEYKTSKAHNSHAKRVTISPTRGGPIALTMTIVDIDIGIHNWWLEVENLRMDHCDAIAVYAANKPVITSGTVPSSSRGTYGLQASVTYTIDETYSANAMIDKPVSFQWSFKHTSFSNGPTEYSTTSTPNVSYSSDLGGNVIVSVRVFDGGNYSDWKEIGSGNAGDLDPGGNCLPGRGCEGPI